jgi:hypothetical protein
MRGERSGTGTFFAGSASCCSGTGSLGPPKPLYLDASSESVPLPRVSFSRNPRRVGRSPESAPVESVIETVGVAIMSSEFVRAASNSSLASSSSRALRASSASSAALPLLSSRRCSSSAFWCSIFSASVRGDTASTSLPDLRRMRPPLPERRVEAVETEGN